MKDLSEQPIKAADASDAEQQAEGCGCDGCEGCCCDGSSEE